MKILAVGITVALAAGAAFASGGRDNVRAPITNFNGSRNLSQDVRAAESWYPLGEQVTFLYTIRNNSSNTVAYNFSSGKQFDVWVTSGGVEVFRLSKGKMYSQALTKITLAPGEAKDFRAVWDQKDFQGKPVTTGWFTVHAQLLPVGARPYEVSSRIWIGNPDIVVPLQISIADAIRRANELNGKTVTIVAFRGTKGSSSDPNIVAGPPVTRSDWIVSDSSGSMYVSGKVQPSAGASVGSSVKVTGKLARTPQGQVYLVAGNAEPAK